MPPEDKFKLEPTEIPDFEQIFVEDSTCTGARRDQCKETKINERPSKRACSMEEKNKYCTKVISRGDGSSSYASCTHTFKDNEIL